MSNSSAILNANGGVHNKRAMKKVKDRLQNHGMKRAILVHIVLTGSQSVQVYRDTYNDIADHLRDHGSRTEYFGCLEMDEVKGLHAHVYFVIETSKKFPHSTLNVNDGEFLHKLAVRRGLNRIHIAQPQNKMHYAKGKPQFFSRLNEEAKLADCLERIEYLYKNRSKENVPSREIYFNSNFEANKAKRAKKKPISDSSPAVLPTAKEVIAVETDCKPLEGDNKPSQWVGIKINADPSQSALNASQTHYNDRGNELKLTAAQNYLSTLYENCIDSDMNLDAIRLYLLEQGIRKTPGQLVDDLDNVFEFLGYAASHPAPALPSLAELDAAIERAPLRANRHDVALISAGETCHPLLPSLHPIRPAGLPHASH